MPVHETREEKELYKKKETYHSEKLVGLPLGVKKKPVAVIVCDRGVGGILEIIDGPEMEYPVDICNI